MANVSLPASAQDATFDACIEMQLLAADTGNDSDEESSASLPDPADDESGRYAVLARELAMLDDRGFLLKRVNSIRQCGAQLALTLMPRGIVKSGCQYKAWKNEFPAQCSNECFELPAFVNIRSCPGIDRQFNGTTLAGSNEGIRRRTSKGKWRNDRDFAGRRTPGDGDAAAFGIGREDLYALQFVKFAADGAHATVARDGGDVKGLAFHREPP